MTRWTYAEELRAKEIYLSSENYAAEAERALGRSRNSVISLARRQNWMRPAPAAEGQPRREGRCCRWPLWGDQGRPTHQYCDAATDRPGAAYCPEHAATARRVIPKAA